VSGTLGGPIRLAAALPPTDASSRPTTDCGRRRTTVSRSTEDHGLTPLGASASCGGGGNGLDLEPFPVGEQSIQWRDATGRTWHEPVALIFTDHNGAPIRRTRFSDVWRRAVKASGAPRDTTFHDLRHFYASLLIRHGENVKVVQRRLGHATAAETLDTYAHLWLDPEDRTRQAIDDVLMAPADYLRNERHDQLAKVQFSARRRTSRPVSRVLSCAEAHGRPSIYDCRCRQPPAVYPGARAGRPRTLPV